MTTPHIRALKAIKDNLLLGPTIEVTTKTPWGFNELDRRQCIHIDNYLLSPPKSINTILHILLGEGQNLEKMQDVIKTSLINSCRVLILEHKHSPTIDILRLWMRATHDRKYGVTEQEIDNRNVLFVITPIFLNDETFNKLNENNTYEHLKVRWRNGWNPLWQISKKRKKDLLFTLSSELDDNGDIFSKIPPTQKYRSMANNFYGVIGGFNFLQVLCEFNFRTETRITFFDATLSQVLMAKHVCNLIKRSSNLEEFDELCKTNFSAFSDVWAEKAYCFCSPQYFNNLIINTPDKINYWKNILLLGSWRNNFAKMKRMLPKIQLSWCPCRELKLQHNDILYVGTILSSEYKHFHKYYLIEANTLKNHNQITWVK